MQRLGDYGLRGIAPTPLTPHEQEALDEVRARSDRLITRTIKAARDNVRKARALKEKKRRLRETTRGGEVRPGGIGSTKKALRELTNEKVKRGETEVRPGGRVVITKGRS